MGESNCLWGLDLGTSFVTVRRRVPPDDERASELMSERASELSSVLCLSGQKGRKEAGTRPYEFES